MMQDAASNHAPLYLAIDQGGHASRALVCDRAGVVVARAIQSLEPVRKGPDCVEYDAPLLFASVRRVIDEVIAGLGDRCGAIIGAGLATQRSTVVCWDRRTGHALSPFISWQDRRANDWLSRLEVNRETVRHITGLPLSAHYGANKLRWCLEELPEVRRAQRAGRLAWGPLASYLLFHLLRERPLFIDPANAARTLLWDLAAGEWSATLLDLFGLPQAPLPAAVPTRHAFGTLAAGGNPVPVTIVTGDQAAALHAHGSPQADTLHVTLGTGAFVQRSTGTRLHASTRLLSGIAFDDGRTRTWTLEGTVNGAGSALDWFARQHPEYDPDALPLLLDTVTAPPLFLNGVSGLGTPFMIADAPTAFVGDGDCPARAVAVAESIVFLLQTNIEAMTEAPPPLRLIRIGGGLARLDGMCQRLADLAGLPVARSDESETTAQGLAWLLREPDAEHAEAPEPSPHADVFQPRDNPTLHRRYRQWRDALASALTTSHRPAAHEVTAPTIVAHRGDAGRFPENTLPAIESALRTGIRHIEIDIQLTADGVPVLFHDDALKRMTGSTGRITRTDRQQLQALHAFEPARFGERFRGTAIPTLASIVELLADWPQAHCFVEIKQESLDAFGIESVVHKVMQTIAPRLGQCTPISFSSDALRAAAALGAPRIGWVLTRYDSAAINEARTLAPDYLFCNQRKLPAARTPIGRGPWRWVIYEVSDPEQAMRLATRGVDMIETMQVERFTDDR